MIIPQIGYHKDWMDWENLIERVVTLSGESQGEEQRGWQRVKVREQGYNDGVIILGVDPGTATMGYGVLEKVGNRYRALVYGTLETPKSLPAPERLRQLHEGLHALIEQFQPDVLVTERLLFSANRRTAIQVARAIGVALLAAAQHHLPWYEYTPMQVKQAVTGYGGADKKQVQQMVKRLLALSELPHPDDAADALALCICHAHHESLTRLAEGAR